MMHHHKSFLKQRWTGACLSLLATGAIFLANIPAHSQDKKQTKSAEDDVVKINSNLVSLDVIVKDKKGKAITDLKPEDFTVFENGVPQKIQFFDSTLTKGSEAGQPQTAGVPIQPESQAPKGFPRNIIALVLDGQTTELANLEHVREGLMKHIRERITDRDSVALFSIS